MATKAKQINTFWDEEQERRIQAQEAKIQDEIETIQRLEKELEETKTQRVDLESEYDPNKEGSYEIGQKISMYHHTENNLKRQLENARQALEISQIKLRNRQDQKALYVSSNKLYEIAKTKQEIAQRIAQAETEIKKAEDLIESLTTELQEAELKADVENSFGKGNSGDYLDKLKRDIEEAKNELDNRVRAHRALVAASDPDNKLCMVNETTPGFQLRKLEKELEEETQKFTEESKAEWDNIVSQISKACATIKQTLEQSFERLGNVKAKVLLRDKELIKAGKPETNLAETLKPPFGNEFIPEKLRGIFNKAVQIGEEYEKSTPPLIKEGVESEDINNGIIES
ncbi:MAG: hypothetical protein ACM3YE_08030 [Bacteroidota bacterium]